jgi:hypothetical protein
VNAPGLGRTVIAVRVVHEAGGRIQPLDPLRLAGPHGVSPVCQRWASFGYVQCTREATFIQLRPARSNENCTGLAQIVDQP